MQRLILDGYAVVRVCGSLILFRLLQALTHFFPSRSAFVSGFDFSMQRYIARPASSSGQLIDITSFEFVSVVFALGQHNLAGQVPSSWRVFDMCSFALALHEVASVRMTLVCSANHHEDLSK